MCHRPPNSLIPNLLSVSLRLMVQSGCQSSHYYIHFPTRGWRKLHRRVHLLVLKDLMVVTLNTLPTSHQPPCTYIWRQGTWGCGLLDQVAASTAMNRNQDLTPGPTNSKARVLIHCLPLLLTLICPVSLLWKDHGLRRKPKLCPLSAA